MLPMNGTWNYRIRKTHRFMGVILGVQFLFWTIGGLYFSWSNMDDVHGDPMKKPTPQYLTNNSAIDKAISKTDIISYLKNGKSLNNNYSLVYFDDLSYNHEYGEILYYENVLAAVKKMPIQYICYNELLVMQGVIEV